MASTSKQRSNSSGSRRSTRPTSRTDARKKSRRTRADKRSATPAAKQTRATSRDARSRSSAPKSSSGKSRREFHLPHINFKRIVLVIVGVVIVGAVSWAVLIATNAFEITSVEAKASKHVDVETIKTLADVKEGSTLLNVDTASIEEGLKKNPWVKDVEITRVFPGTLQISVVERKVAYIVVMSSGTLAWNLGDDGVWIEPLTLEVPEGSSVADVALTQANEIGAVLISDVGADINPRAGRAVSSSDVVGNVLSYMRGFSKSFRKQIVSFSASSSQAISCTLASGVNVSLGPPSDISQKEAVVTAILKQYPDQVTYINVRVPSSPALRKVDAPSVQQGTGATGTSDAPSEEASTTETDDAAADDGSGESQ